MTGYATQTVAFYLGMGAVILLAVWVAIPSSADHRLLRARCGARLARWVISTWGRAFLWWASWPHLVDRFTGMSRAKVDPTPSEDVWREGKATLRRYRGDGTRRYPILLVHALVTRPWILDLAPGRSLVGALRDAGFDVYLLDWGDAGKTEARRGLASYAATLMRAESAVLDAAGAERLHMAAYCSAATLCLARLGAYDHPHVASFAGIAPPVDLAVPSRMAEMLSHRFLKPVLLLDQDGCVPAAYIRESFHVLRPQALRIVRGAFRRRGDATFRATYGPLSRWAYEHRRIPGALFFDLVELYRTNALYQGGLTSQDGRPVALSNVRAPMLVALATRDHIVPGASSHALASIVPGTETLACPSGHVSMLSGTGAHEVLWPGLTGFFARMEAGSRRPRTRRRPGASGAKKKGPGGASA